MFAGSDVMHFFTHEFSSLGGWGLALPPVAAGAFEGFLFWHNMDPQLHPVSSRGLLHRWFSRHPNSGRRLGALRLRSFQLRFGFEPILQVAARDSTALFKERISAPG